MIRRSFLPSGATSHPTRRVVPIAALVAATLVGACASSPRMQPSVTPSASGAGAGAHAGHDATRAVTPSGASDPSLPADAASARARLDRSPRHGEWQMVRVPGAAGAADSVRAWVVYPERATKAPVVLVVHEIFGLSSWVRAVADQLAEAGFIAVAPDLLTGHMGSGNPDSLDVQAAVAQIRRLEGTEVQRRLAGLATWAMARPAAAPRYGIVGFCWGGATSFEHAVTAPGLNAPLGAAVVYYGTSPATPLLATVRAPVLGLYGGDDARVNATIAPADSALRALGRTYVHETYAGAGHGFLRQQDGRGGANLEATRRAWPRTIAWFRQHLGS
jgi:carboxymethylenebutenolidase